MKKVWLSILFLISAPVSAGTTQFDNISVRGTTQSTGTISGPGSGITGLNASNLSSGTVPNARMPNPGASALGGTESLTCSTHQWWESLSTSGVPACTQPAAADLSDGTTGSGALVLVTSPTLITPALGTPSALVGTNISGTGASFTAGHVTTNANLTGPITSSGNATAVASQTGTGSKFVMDTSPTISACTMTGTSTFSVMSSATANSSTGGKINFANNNAIEWRNSGNSADIAFGTGSSDAVPSWGGVDLGNVSGSQTFSNKTLTAPTLTGAVLDTGTMAVNNAASQLAVGTGLDSGSKVIIGGSDTAITSGSANGLFINWTGNSNNTSNMKAIVVNPTTPASTTLNRVVGLQTNLNLGSGGTLNNYVGIADPGAPSHVGTNNVSFSDNESSTGNWFFNQSGTDPSLLGGNLQLGGSTIYKGSSSGTVTIGAPATVTSYAMTWPAGQSGTNQYLRNNGSGGLSWASSSSTLTNPTVQKFTSGTGTYTTPTGPGPLYIKITMVGGGGGGSAGSALGSAGGSNGGNSTFGTSLLVAGGGAGSTQGSLLPGVGGAGGTASLGSGPIGLALVGGMGAPGSSQGSSVGATSYVAGGSGASSPLGGAGAGGTAGAAAGSVGAANTGAGGGGGGFEGTGAALTNSGGGGGAGGYVSAIINSPTSTYSFVVGSGGAGGTGTNAGGTGAAGVILVEEFYQ